MRIQLGPPVLLLLLSLVVVLIGSATATLAEDSDDFWKRLLQDRAGSIVPTPGPAPTSERPVLEPATLSPSPLEEPQTNFPTEDPGSVPTEFPDETPVPAPPSTEDPSSSESRTPVPTPTLETPTPVPGPTDEPVPPIEGPTSPPAEVDSLLPVTMFPTVTPATSGPVDPATPPVLPPFPGTVAPTGDECTLTVDFTCVIADGDSPNAGKSCESPDIEVQPCTSRPTGATMLFNGGGCDQSDNRQFLQFTCMDMNGGPPMDEGDEAYIVVSDIKGLGIIYFEGIVAVGDEFPLNDDGERFETDQSIMIFTPDQSTILQLVIYHSSCSSNLELKNRFGASQLVGFYNEAQGNVTCFETFNLFIDVIIPVSVAGESATFQTMTAMTNFAGFLDLTDQVVGQTVESGGSFPVILEGTLDLTERKTYSALFTVTAVSNPSGQLCQGMSFDSFVAGNPVPEGLPTAAPTITPTFSPAPTFDPGTTACTIGADIKCERIKNGRVVGSCEDIPDPRGVTCTGGYPTSLSFLYTGAETVTVSVEARSTTSTFTVNSNEVFTASGVFNEGANIDIEGGESFSIDTSCGSDSELTLGNVYGDGSLELVGFENGDGSFTSIYPIQVSYSIRNSPYAAILESALISSDFQPEPIEAVESEVNLARGETLVVFKGSTTVNAQEKYSQGIVFNFVLDATARGAVSGIPCEAEAVYSF